MAENDSVAASANAAYSPNADDPFWNKRLDYIAELSRNGGKLFTLMLTACAYAWLTIASTTDVALLTNTGSWTLPVVEREIRILWFYTLAPLLLCALGIYLHHYLQGLWVELAELPEKLGDPERERERQTYPWILNDIICLHRPRRPLSQKLVCFLQNPALAIAEALTWGTVPITLGYFWFRYLSRHDIGWTLWHLFLILLSGWNAIYAYGTAIRTFEQANATTGREAEPPAAPQQGATMSGTGAPSKEGPGWARGRARALRGWLREWVSPLPGAVYLLFGTLLFCLGFSCFVILVGAYPVAELQAAEIAAKPTGWTGDKPEELLSVKRVDIARRNLRHAAASGAFLVRVDLRKAALQGAELEGADLRRADLTEAHLERAVLVGAHLEDADLGRAHLDDSDLVGARLRNADLRGACLNKADLSAASLQSAVLRESDLSKANLHGADLYAADLRKAKLRKADLHDANLYETDLREAKLSGANLYATQLPRADLRDADLNEADLHDAVLFRADLRKARLSGADLREADLTDARLEGADLRGAKDLTQHQIDGAFTDETTRVSKGLRVGRRKYHGPPLKPR